MTPNDYRNPFKIKILDQRKSRNFFSKLDFLIFEGQLFPEFLKNLKSLNTPIGVLRDFSNLLVIFKGVGVKKIFFHQDKKKVKQSI